MGFVCVYGHAWSGVADHPEIYDIPVTTRLLADSPITIPQQLGLACKLAASGGLRVVARGLRCRRSKHPNNDSNEGRCKEVRPMATNVLWHGSQTEALELLQALSRNCSCVVTAEGVRLSTCAPHEMLSSDQRAIDGLLLRGVSRPGCAARSSYPCLPKLLRRYAQRSADQRQEYQRGAEGALGAETAAPEQVGQA